MSTSASNLAAPHRAINEADDGPAFGFVDLLTWLGEAKRFIGGITAVAIVGSVIYALVKPPEFTARATMLAPASQQQGGAGAALAALGGVAAGLATKSPDEMYVALLKSDTVYRALDARFDLRKHYEADSHDGLARALQGAVRVGADKKSGLIAVEVDDRDPKFAADLANAHASEITRLLDRLAVSEAQQRRVFFEKQMQGSKEALIQAETKLREVQEKSGMVVLDKQAEAIIDAVAQLKSRIAEREVQLRVMRTTATAANPALQRLASEVAALRGELARMESATGTGEGSRGIDIPVGRLPAASVDYVRALREVKFQEALLTSMVRQFEVAKLDEAKEGRSLQQVDIAQPPDRKSKPRRSVIVLTGTLAALLLSSLIVVIRRYVRHASTQDAEREAAWSNLRRAWRLRG